MSLQFGAGGIESRFEAYVDNLSSALRHADRVAPFRFYCAELSLPGDRKSVEPMAAQTEPRRVQATHQLLHHMVAKADRSNQAVLAAVRSQMLPKITQAGAVNAWIIDDTKFPKKARTRSAWRGSIAVSLASRTTA